MSNLPAPGERPTAVTEFLDKLRTRVPATITAPGGGRLIVAIDATASREPTWDQAARIQGEMFEATAAMGGLAIQLVFYRDYAECRSSAWVTTAPALHRLMANVRCVAGSTQIAKVLNHAIAETRRHKVGALLFVGDAFEESVDAICSPALELGKLGVPVFLFQEGHDPGATAAFAQIARLTGGAHLTFDSGSIHRLKELLGAVAVYAAGGKQALLTYGEGKTAVLQLTSRLGR
jgi:hypothetical protein